jgi:hypothetical protein
MFLACFERAGPIFSDQLRAVSRAKSALGEGSSKGGEKGGGKRQGDDGGGGGGSGKKSRK